MPDVVAPDDVGIGIERAGAGEEREITAIDDVGVVAERRRQPLHKQFLTRRTATARLIGDALGLSQQLGERERIALDR